MQMEYTDKEYCLEVWGDMACFTRPEFKVERVSYDIITPSAARAIFEAILFKRYAMRWQVTKIEVLNPIKWTSIRRNEVGAVASKNPIIIEDKRQQKNTLALHDVRYRIWAKLMFIPVKDRPKEAFAKHKPGGAHASLQPHGEWLIPRKSHSPLLSQRLKTLASCSTTWTIPILKTSRPCSIALR